MDKELAIYINNSFLKKGEKENRLLLLPSPHPAFQNAI
jgi:hypothetical protein